MSNQDRKRRREPRKGALVAAVLLIFVATAVLAAYYLAKYTSGTQIVALNKNETPLYTTARPQPDTPPDVAAPDLAQSPAAAPQGYPETEKAPRDKTSDLNLETGAGRLAIIIDDMGSSISEARSLAAIGVPLTFSVIPGLHSYREVARFAESKGIEIMLHIPMQSKGWPEKRLESNGLLITMDGDELGERVSRYLREIPEAVGANNHMGSEFTEHEDKMRRVLEPLKSNNIFFVDSVTSSQTVGMRLAREMGIKSGRRNVFLDNEQEHDYIMGQLGQAVKLAKKNGSAIAICHPHPETIRTLASALPGLSAGGITLVKASQLVR